jgi:hypothetical protein
MLALASQASDLCGYVLALASQACEPWGYRLALALHACDPCGYVPSLASQASEPSMPQHSALLVGLQRAACAFYGVRLAV